MTNGPGTSKTLSETDFLRTRIVIKRIKLLLIIGKTLILKYLQSPVDSVRKVVKPTMLWQIITLFAVNGYNIDRGLSAQLTNGKKLVGKTNSLYIFIETQRSFEAITTSITDVYNGLFRSLIFSSYMWKQ